MKSSIYQYLREREQEKFNVFMDNLFIWSVISVQGLFAIVSLVIHFSK